MAMTLAALVCGIAFVCTICTFGFDDRTDENEFKYIED